MLLGLKTGTAGFFLLQASLISNNAGVWHLIFNTHTRESVSLISDAAVRQSSGK